MTNPISNTDLTNLLQKVSELPNIPTELREEVLSLTKTISDYQLVPKNPSTGKLVSMALRYDHGLGLPEFYNSLTGDPQEHQRRLTSTISTMRQLYKEAVDNGFYRPELEESYLRLLPDTKENNDRN